MLLIWGTYRIIGARNTRGSETMELEDQWDFGQTLPVLLLIGPLLIIVRSIFTHKCSRVSTTPITPSNDSPPPSQQKEKISHSLPDEAMLSMTQSSASDAPNPSPNHQLELPGPRIPKRSYLNRFWAGPCILLPWMSLVIFAVQVLQSIIDQSGGSTHVPQWPIFTFSVKDFRPLPYLFLFHPIVCHLSVLAGISLENSKSLGARHRVRRLMHLLLCFALLGLFITWTFYLPLFSEESDVYPGIPLRRGKSLLVGFIISAGCYAVYCVAGVASGLRNMRGTVQGE